MLHMTPESLACLAKLREELAWLKAEHPDKEALIGLAEVHLETIRQAGSTESVRVRMSDDALAWEK